MNRDINICFALLACQLACFALICGALRVLLARLCLDCLLRLACSIVFTKISSKNSLINWLDINGKKVLSSRVFLNLQPSCLNYKGFFCKISVEHDFTEGLSSRVFLKISWSAPNFIKLFNPQDFRLSGKNRRFR